MGYWYYTDTPGWAALDYPDWPRVDHQFNAFEMPWLLSHLVTALWLVLP